MCKQLNGPVLKITLKRAALAEIEKNLSARVPCKNFVLCFKQGRVRTEVSISISSRAGLGPKFHFMFRAVSIRKFQLILRIDSFLLVVCSELKSVFKVE